MRLYYQHDRLIMAERGEIDEKYISSKGNES